MSIILVGQTISAIAVIILILLQNRSGGAGSAFGGGGGGGDFAKKRRGSEKFLFIATIALTVIFTLLSIINLMLH